MRGRVWLLVFLLVNAVALTGCGSITVQPSGEPTRVAEVLTSTAVVPSATPFTPSPTSVPISTATLPVPTPSTVPSPTVAPSATAVPTMVIVTPTPLDPALTDATPVVPTPAGPGFTAFRQDEGIWTVQYPADLLKIEELDQDITLFISADRATVAAVDTYIAEGNEYGNTGENLRNRAQDTLAQIYGRPVNLTDFLPDPEGNWVTGITFTTDSGSKGEAVYMQPGFRQGDRRVYGFIYGYKAANEGTILPLLQAIRTSFQASAQSGPPPLLLIQNDAILEQRGTGPAEQIASVPEMGQLAGAGSFGDVVLILGERGLYRVLLSDGSIQLLQQFSGPVRFGQILVSGESAIVAATVDDADAQFGFRTHIGLYDHIVDSFSLMPGTPELEQYTSLQPLGSTANGNGIYVLPRGQDPAFGRVVVLATETGEILQDLPIVGEGSIVLSPDSRTIVTIDRAVDDPASFVAKFYDLETQPLEPRSMLLPPELGDASALWSPDSRALFLLGSRNVDPPTTHPLWRLDVATGGSTQVVVLDQVEQLVAISPDGLWLLVRSSSGNVGALVDLQSGISIAITVAPEAFVAGWR